VGSRGECGCEDGGHSPCFVINFAQRVNKGMYASAV